MKIILDTNIYDFLAIDSETCDLVKGIVNSGQLTVIVTRTVAEELFRSPFEGIPNFFKTEYQGNTVSRCGLMCAGDSLGAGEVFDAHLGKSKKVNDALIADSASYEADWVVSEDSRLRKRFAKLNSHCQSMSYGEFKANLREMVSSEDNNLF
jgi:hypothetical protein